jgi:ABC-2 type transport system ATP-binding protein
VSPPAIAASALTKTFGGFTAVDGLSFTVEAGSIFGLLGANGAGKSTTIRMLCGLLRPSSGGARVAGFDIDREPERVKQSIGYMSQHFSLYNDLTVAENIRFFAGVYGLDSRELRLRSAWALAMADLEGSEQALTGELSGGWKQRLALACAVLHRPRIVFLDEPTGGVDPVSRRRFWRLINSLAGEGVTVLVTTHTLDEAEYCNHILLMNEGRLLAAGSPRELKDSVIEAPVLELRCPQLMAGLALLQNRGWVGESSVFGAALHVGLEGLSAAAGRAKIRRLFADRGLAVTRIDTIVPSLEDVFIRLLERAGPGRERGGGA